eukprot:scaffold12914_cov96-Isochrysis_galbana.AAC.1
MARHSHHMRHVRPKLLRHPASPSKPRQRQPRVALRPCPDVTAEAICRELGHSQNKAGRLLRKRRDVGARRG